MHTVISRIWRILVIHSLLATTRIELVWKFFSAAYDFFIMLSKEVIEQFKKGKLESQEKAGV